MARLFNAGATTSAETSESASRNALATFDADFTADNVYGRYADLLTTIASGG